MKFTLKFMWVLRWSSRMTRQPTSHVPCFFLKLRYTLHYVLGSRVCKSDAFSKSIFLNCSFPWCSCLRQATLLDHHLMVFIIMLLTAVVKILQKVKMSHLGDKVPVHWKYFWKVLDLNAWKGIYNRGIKLFHLIAWNFVKRKPLCVSCFLDQLASGLREFWIDLG